MTSRRNWQKKLRTVTPGARYQYRCSACGRDLPPSSFWRLFLPDERASVCRDCYRVLTYGEQAQARKGQRAGQGSRTLEQLRECSQYVRDLIDRVRGEK